ncbi:MAG: inositol monophosphatase [Chloroflexi bacterium]|nr:inositol monophosphatase [Chloroflexota bacterium]
MTAEPSLREMEILARQAGAILKTLFGHRLQVGHKSHWIDLVTEADQRAEAFLLAQLRERYPDHGIFAEESGSRPTRPDGPRWYVDPLDGTVNYAHGMPYFAVSLAYADAQGVRLGVVYAPMQDECFCAARGQGAWLNGRPIRVAQRTRLADSLLITGFPYDMWTNPNNNVANYDRFLRRTQGVLRLGAAALDLCYVAAGRADGFWELRLKPWDVAAGGLIVREAGGVITDLEGHPDYLASEQPSVVAANPILHQHMLAVLQGQEPENPREA